MGRRRARNEDALGLEEGSGLALVADGIGGLPAGDVASALAVSAARSHLGDGRLPAALSTLPGSRSPLGERMLEAVFVADQRVRMEAAADPAKAGMGTTLTALALRADEGRAVIGHVGDSRAYLYRDGRLLQLTRDDSWVQEQMDSGRLSAGEARGHPWAHVITQGVGVGDEIAPELVERDAAPGDVYLLCTDGLTTMLTDVAIERSLAVALPAGLDAATRSLVDAANDCGGYDNITVVLVRIDAD